MLIQTHMELDNPASVDSLASFGFNGLVATPPVAGAFSLGRGFCLRCSGLVELPSIVACGQAIQVLGKKNYCMMGLNTWPISFARS